ncbi:MAG: hypothetical protein M0Z48_04680 [Nitrospiraceae bacterium]|nr:hypothetical protein [Nitrospiraceae bacterium]
MACERIFLPKLLPGWQQQAKTSEAARTVAENDASHVIPASSHCNAKLL